MAGTTRTTEGGLLSEVHSQKWVSRHGTFAAPSSIASNPFLAPLIAVRHLAVSDLNRMLRMQVAGGAYTIANIVNVYSQPTEYPLSLVTRLVNDARRAMELDPAQFQRDVHSENALANVVGARTIESNLEGHPMGVINTRPVDIISGTDQPDHDVNTGIALWHPPGRNVPAVTNISAQCMRTVTRAAGENDYYLGLRQRACQNDVEAAALATTRESLRAETRRDGSISRCGGLRRRLGESHAQFNQRLLTCSRPTLVQTPRAPEVVGLAPVGTDWQVVPYVYNPADLDKGYSSHHLPAAPSTVATTQSTSTAVAVKVGDEQPSFWHRVGQVAAAGHSMVSYYMGNDPCRTVDRRRLVASTEELATQAACVGLDVLLKTQHPEDSTQEENDALHTEASEEADTGGAVATGSGKDHDPCEPGATLENPSTTHTKGPTAHPTAEESDPLVECDETKQGATAYVIAAVVVVAVAVVLVQD